MNNRVEIVLTVCCTILMLALMGVIWATENKKLDRRTEDRLIAIEARIGTLERLGAPR